MNLPQRIIASLILGLACAATGGGFTVARAQEVQDSAAIARSILSEQGGATFEATARLRLMRLLRSGNGPAIVELLRFMARRDSAWLAPEEQLGSEALATNLELLRETGRLEALLARAEAVPGGHPAYTDGLARLMRDLIRERAGLLGTVLDERKPTNAERHFFNLLLNHLYANGYRAREDLNAQVGDFARRFVGSPLVPLAERHIRRPYREEPLGAAFNAGYGRAGFIGNLGERVGSAHGPALAGELYLYEGVLSMSFMFGTASVENDFTAGGDTWGHGNAPFVHAAFDLGYEFRFDRLALVPMAGLALFNLRAPVGVSAGSDAELPRTGDRFGIDVGGLVGYRLPSDQGPHLDFRLRLGASGPGFSGYDRGLGGVMWYAQLGFALVQRPYRAR